MVLWLDIQRILPNADLWPSIVRCTFWRGTLNYRDRVLLAAFGFFNGVDPEFLCAVLRETNPFHSTNNKLNKIKELYNYWEGDDIIHHERRQRYYTYSFYHKRLVTLNGDPHDKQVSTRRYNVVSRC